MDEDKHSKGKGFLLLLLAIHSKRKGFLLLLSAMVILSLLVNSPNDDREGEKKKRGNNSTTAITTTPQPWEIERATGQKGADAEEFVTPPALPTKAMNSGAAQNSTASAPKDDAPAANATKATSSAANHDAATHWYQNEMQRQWCTPPDASELFESPRLVMPTDFALSKLPNKDYRRKNYSQIEKETQIDEALPPPAVTSNSSSTNNDFDTERASSPVIHKAAICRILSSPYNQHFPHFMQHFLKCVDYWIDSGCSGSDSGLGCVPLLLHEDDEHIRKLFRNAFGRGVLEFAESSLGLAILPKHEYYKCHLTSSAEEKRNSSCSKLYHPDQTIRQYRNMAGYYFQHAKEWNKRMESYLHASTAIGGPAKGRALLEGRGTASAPACAASPPRIGILNRGRTRKILNADEIAKALAHALYRKEPEKTNNDTATTNTSMAIDFHPRLPPPAVTITHFEDKSFLEQVEFFRENDIVISGHGAQLTGLVFMPNDVIDDETRSKSCKHVVELFPKNYGIPDFFGSLAVQSGIGHSYVYYDDGLASSAAGTPPSFGDDGPGRRERAPLVVLKPWEAISGRTASERSRARSSLFCPRSKDVVGYISRIMQEWYRCQGC